MTIENVLKSIPNRPHAFEFSGVSGSENAYFLSRIYTHLRCPICIIVSSAQEGIRLIDDLKFFLSDTEFTPLFFPAYHILPFSLLPYHNKTATTRISVLYQLISAGIAPIVVVSVEALLFRIIPKKALLNYAELLMAGEECDRDMLIEKLMKGGYSRTTIVEEPGDVAIRGGILDVFSPSFSDPIRIEFFGNQVESIRTFSAANQRKLKNIPEVVILPAKETVIEGSRLQEMIRRIRVRAAEIEMPVSLTRNMIEQIRQDTNYQGMESLVPLIYTCQDTLFDYLPDNTVFVQIEPRQIAAAAEQFADLVFNGYQQARENNQFCIHPDRYYLSWDDAARTVTRNRPINLSMLPISGPPSDQHTASPAWQVNVQNNDAVRAAMKTADPEGSLLRPLVDWINRQRQSGCRSYVVCRTKAQADRIAALLQPHGISVERNRAFHHENKSSEVLTLTIGDLSTGFVWVDEGIAIITEVEIFGTKKFKKIKTKSQPRTELLVFEDLEEGDVIVHQQHGIGRYDGLVKLSVNGTSNDFLLILYRNDDKLYLPVDRMNAIQKYMGIEGVQPVLDKMGGKAWERIKARAKRSAEKIAGQLLKLYAERRVNKGFAFQLIDEHLSEFESGFAYDETADQLKAIEDVMQDMADRTPMDRLVCGDVGYGKTEVALRAAFLSVFNGKQVAMLVPTTVLAEQHYTTFVKRFNRFPVRIACLNRFRSSKQQKTILKDLSTGGIDIVIGTHRMLSKDVKFKDLGLIVLDEEQRFGVKHKEKLKQLRQTVDVLALTATPIPRTLHMSLMGIRDISVISTPPEYRRAIVTYISEFDSAIVTEAVRKELHRDGQIFFIHNNIQTIETMAARLKRLIPEVRLAVAHGRMDEEALEMEMLRFVNKEIDMLVCTTIVESGLDIPAANTILINRADKFGLAQMYQLRGRVGRADEQAYAYLFIPHQSILTKNAKKRLKVLMEHSDLGSGFQIAMSDLQIRGGGTILGADQSGHIAAVGYGLFLQLMEQAIAELKGETVSAPLDPEININVSAYIPESYIPDIDQRLSLYRRLAKVNVLDEIDDINVELTDRFGAAPQPVHDLYLKIVLKVLSRNAGIKRLDMRENLLSLHMSEAHQRQPVKIVELIQRRPKQYQLTPDHILKIKFPKGFLKGGWDPVKKVLKEIHQHVNN